MSLAILPEHRLHKSRKRDSPRVESCGAAQGAPLSIWCQCAQYLGLRTLVPVGTRKQGTMQKLLIGLPTGVLEQRVHARRKGDGPDGVEGEELEDVIADELI